MASLHSRRLAHTVHYVIMSSPPLPAVLNPCYQVRRTCGMLMEDPESPVSVNEEGIHKFVEELRMETTTTTTTTPLANVQWDAEGWHYAALEIQDATTKRERIALYILALDAINFCFWPSPAHSQIQNTLEYNHLAIALKELATANNEEQFQYFFAPQHLATITEQEMTDALKPHLQQHNHHLSNLSERCRLWNELGAGLELDYKGSALNLIDACHNSAPRLVKLLISSFSGFRDETLFEGKWACFYKRAQIAVADLNAALSLNLQGIDELTTFADYRVPQLLRHVHVLEYTKELADAVDNQMELPQNQEVYIRAATVVAVDRLVNAYNNNNKNTTTHTNAHPIIMTAVTMDWHLWQVGEELNQNNKMKPHHRVNTIFY